MNVIFNTENMRAVGEFIGLIPVAHKLTPAQLVRAVFDESQVFLFLVIS